MLIEGMSRLSHAKSRSISAENPTGEKGRGAMAEPSAHHHKDCPPRELGKGWKCRPRVSINPGESFTLADINESGIIQSMRFGGYTGRDFILRIFWDDQAQPSVECPLPDFFALPWVTNALGPVKGPYVQINSLPVSVNPNRGLNCFWEMPFKKHCRIVIENIHPREAKVCTHQINYSLTEISGDIGLFHAQYRRVNPLPYGEVYTLLDGVKGRGHYVGTSMGWGINNNGWWGEGEIKFYLDGDREYPTICGTGVEDYFGGSYNWEVDGQYVTYSTPFLGMHQVLRPDGLYQSQHRHAMYRWHIADPIRFEEDIHVTIQALGWRSEKRCYPGQHDICSVAYWYQTLPTAPFPRFSNRDFLEIV